MAAGALAALERTRDAYGGATAEAKLALLARLERTRLRTAREVERLHEALCFLRAYPDDARVLARVERMLARFGRRPDLRRHRDALADSGIAGAAIYYRFFWPMARWLSRRWPDRLRLVRTDRESGERIAAALPLLVTRAEAAALGELRPPGYAALNRLRARGETDAVFLVRRVEELPGDGFTREAFFDALDASLELAPGPDTPARTHAKHAVAPPVFQTGPLPRHRPDLRAELRRAPVDVRVVAPRTATRVIDLARAAMVTRSRDLDAFAYGDPRDVRIVDDGKGLAYTVNGVVPERRAVLPATYGLITLRNGVPIGYIQADVIGRSAALSFNTFPTFRGAEAAFTFARMLAALRYLFGAESFSIEPYQLGKGNEEGIESGAWWFYYKLGFRPRASDARRIAREEVARIRANPRHRSTRSTLLALAEHHVFFDLDPARSPGLPPVAQLGLRVADALAARAQGDRTRALRELTGEAMRLTGLRSLHRFTRGERLAWERWSPLVATLPGVSRWSRADRRALAAVVRAKGARSESEFLRRFAAHRRLRRALLGADG
jgi:hypothetical protein